MAVNGLIRYSIVFTAGAIVAGLGYALYYVWGRPSEEELAAEAEAGTKDADLEDEFKGDDDA